MPTARIELAAGTYDYDIDGTPGTVTIPTLTSGSIDQSSPTVGDTLTVSGSNASASATYQWEVDTGSGFVAVSGATSASLDTTGEPAGDYRRVVTDGVQTATTTAVTVAAAAGFTETGVTSVNGSTYLTAGSTVADAPGYLFFASVENAPDDRQHLIGVNGANTGFMTDFGGGDGLVTPRVPIVTKPSGAVTPLSAFDYSTSERLHILVTATVDGSDQTFEMQIWDSVNGWRSAASNNSAFTSGNTFDLSAANWAVFGRGGDPTNQGFGGICYRLAAWTFSNIADVPDITSATVRDWFASGGSLVDPATSRGNITGTPLIDLSGSVADWNAGTHDGSLTLTSTGNFT